MAVTASVSQLQQEAKVKQTFSDAFYHCINILKSEQEYTTDFCDEKQSQRSLLLGQEMFEFFKEIREKLSLEEINSCQPVIVKQESPSEIQLINPANEHSVFVNKPEDSDLKLDSDTCVDKKFENNVEVKGEQNVKADEETRKRSRTRRKVQQVVFYSSDSEDRDDDSDYNYDDDNDSNNDHGDSDPGYDIFDETRAQKRQKTNSGNFEMNKTRVILSNNFNHNNDNDDDIGDSSDSSNNCNDVSGDSDDDAGDEDNDDMLKCLTEKKKKRIPYSVKKNIVKMSREHPNWSWQKIKVESGCSQLKDENELRRWQEIVDTSSINKCHSDKRELVNKHVYQKVIGTKKNKNKVTTDMLVNWFIEGENKYLPKNYASRLSEFRAKVGWSKAFRKRYKITGPSHDLQLANEKKKNLVKNCSDKEQKNIEIGDDDNSDGDEYVDESDAGKTNKRKTVAKKKAIFPYEEKVKAVTVAMRHPTWSIKKIKNYINSKYLKTWKQLRYLGRNLAAGGTYEDRRTVMNYWIYCQCLTYKKYNKMLSTDTLVNWAREAQKNILNEILPINGKVKAKFSDKFHESRRWLDDFKKKFNIVGQSPALSVDEKFINVHKNSEHYQFDEDSPDAPIIVDIGNDMKILKIDQDALKKYIKPMKAKKSLYVSFEDRVNAVKMFTKNPTAESFKIIKKNIKGCKNLKHTNNIKQWADQIKFGPTKHDKSYAINTWVYNKCLDYKKTNKVLDPKLLKNWLIEAKKTVLPEYKGEELFKNPTLWLPDFKKRYNITGYRSDLQLESLNDQINAGENESSDGNNDDSSDNESDQESAVKKRNFLSTEEKIRILKMARENPTWTMKELKKVTGCKLQVNADALRRWKKHIENKNTNID